MEVEEKLYLSRIFDNIISRPTSLAPYIPIFMNYWFWFYIFSNTEDTKRGLNTQILGTLPKPNKQHSPSVSPLKNLVYFSDQNYTIHYGITESYP